MFSRVIVGVTVRGWDSGWRDRGAEAYRERHADGRTVGRRCSVFVGAAFLALAMVGCGGGGSSSNPNPPVQTISVTLAAQPPSSLNTNATTSITANVSNDSANAGVRWTVSCGSATCGSFNPTQTASGGATVFTAPAAVPSGNTVTVTATSVTDSTKTAAATITITAPAQPISVTLAAQPPMSLVAGTTTSLTANVANDSANAGVNWTVTCGGSPCGSFSPARTASGVATTYTAPATVPTGNTVTLTATSVTDSTKTATASITITAPVVPISVTLAAQPPSSLTVNGSTGLIANVANDTANAGVKWTATCGTSPCGAFNPATTASGALTIFMAPSAVPTGNTVTLTATSVTDSTKTASATITVAGLSGSPLANGTYVYHLAGQGPNGASFFAGAFTLTNGTITAGEQDYADEKIYSSDTVVSGSGISYNASNGGIQLLLSLSNKNLGIGGVITLHGTKVSAQRVLLTGYDDFFAGTGSIDLQTSQAAPSGGYAFLIGGIGFSNGGGATPTTIGGVLNFSGTTLALANSVYDVNFGQGNLSAQAFTAGSVSAPDSLGRVTIGFTPNSNTGLTDFILAGYIVSPTQIQLVETNDDQNFDLAGMALGQGSNTGGFSAASLSGKTYTFGSSGSDQKGLGVNLAGTLAFGSNTVSGTIAVNDLSAYGINTITGGSYTVDATGRVTITNITLSGIMDTLAFQAYLDGNGNALVMGADGVETTAGPGYVQTTTSPGAAGSYALMAMGFGPGSNSGGNLIDANPWSAAGPLTINSGSYVGFTDYNNVGTPTPSVSLTGTTSTGTISLTGLNPASLTTTANAFVSYPIDANRSVLMSIDPGLLSLGSIESVKP